MKRKGAVPERGSGEERAAARQRRGGNAPPPSKRMSKGPPPRALSAMDFAAERLQDVRELQKSIEQQQKVTGSQFSIPRYLRRRAASHNAYRVPPKHRQRVKMLLEKSKIGAKTGSRATHLRMRRYRSHPIFMRSYDNRQLNGRWLETHVWHAKRMLMAEYYGRKVAMRPRDKGARSMYRSVSSTCVVHDASYMDVIELQGDSGLIVTALRQMMEPKGVNILAGQYRSGARFGRAVLHARGAYPELCLGPVRFQWMARGLALTLQRAEEDICTDIDPNESVLWLWTHPSSTKLIASSIEAAARSLSGESESPAFTCVVQEGNPLLFQLRGPQATRVLWRALQPYPEASAGHDKEVWERIGSTVSAGSLPARGVRSFVFSDPRVSFPPHREPFRSAMASGISLVERARAAKALVLHFHSPQSDRFADGSLRKVLRQRIPSQHDVNEARAKLISRSAPVAFPALQARMCGLVHIVPGVAKSGKRGSYMSGIDVIVPAGWGMAVLRSLVYAGARARGVRCFDAVLPDAGGLAYPECFPDAPGFPKHELRLFTERATRYLRKPVKKRPNYVRLRSPSPFTPTFSALLPAAGSNGLGDVASWIHKRGRSTRHKMAGAEGMPESLASSVRPIVVYGALLRAVISARQKIIATIEQASFARALPDVYSHAAKALWERGLVPCEIRLLGRGAPEAGALVCLPLAPDAKEIRRDKGQWHRLEKKGTVDQSLPTRKVLGFVVQGAHAFRHGRGAGVAFVALAEWLQMPGREALVVVRNATSPAYRSARLRPMTELWASC